MRRSQYLNAAVLCSGLLEICGAVPVLRSLNAQIQHFEPLHLEQSHLSRRAADGQGSRPISRFHLPITAFNRSIRLDLKPAAHLFSHSPTLYHTHENGTTESEPLTTFGYYSGTVLGWPKSFVHLAIGKDGYINAMIDDGKDDALYIEPAVNHFDVQQQFEHVIYRESDFVYTKGPNRRPSCSELTPPPVADPKEGGDRDHLKHRGSRSRRAAEVMASPFVHGQHTCHMALFADASFLAEFNKVGSSAVVTMISRFSKAADVIKTTGLAMSGIPVTINLRISKVILSNTTVEGTTATTWLEKFSTNEADRDWREVCLAQAYTHTDFAGTLGLAWTAYPKSSNQNGGICQSAYKNTVGRMVSLNTGFHTSLNFGSKQPELQTALVLAHEVGHNFGAPHDGATPDQSATDVGNFLMFPFAVSGEKSNNAKFSAASIDSINSAVRDRAGCFLPSTGENRPSPCGNFIREGSEQCDCGGDDVTCAAWDKCCSSSCKFANSSKCSPMDQDHGVCCTDTCLPRNTSFQCNAKSECKAEAYCSSDSPPKCIVQTRKDFSMCESGVTSCPSGTCSMMCKSGACTESICSLWNQTLCNPGAGAGACEIKCQTASGQCVSPANLPPRVQNVTVYGGADAVATAVDFDIRYKAPGSGCEFTKDEKKSGFCNIEGKCVSADNEGQALNKLYNQYGQQLSNFAEWVEEDERGLPRWAWMTIGFCVLMMLCCVMCYIGNQPDWPERVDEFCHKNCLCFHKDVDDWDPVKNRERREMVKLGNHGVRKKKLPPVLSSAPKPMAETSVAGESSGGTSAGESAS